MVKVSFIKIIIAAYICGLIFSFDAAYGQSVNPVDASGIKGDLVVHIGCGEGDEDFFRNHYKQFN